MTDSIRKNRDRLMSMMAMSEEIGRTNNRIYNMMMTLAENPQDKQNLYNSIDELIEKVTKLKKVELAGTFIENTNLRPLQSQSY